MIDMFGAKTFFLDFFMLGTEGMSCVDHKQSLVWNKNTTSLETMASWALKNPARKITNFKGYDQYVWS